MRLYTAGCVSFQVSSHVDRLFLWNSTETPFAGDREFNKEEISGFLLVLEEKFKKLY
jgi:hypothetical protein